MGCSTRVALAGLAVTVACVVPPAWAQTASGPATTRAADEVADVEAAYRQRLASLGDRDIDGHYALAEWCRRQGRYDLVLAEAKKILAIDPRHENAAILRKLAERKLREARAATTRKAGRAATDLVREADIQRLRLAEFLTDRGEETVRVEFAKGFLDRFARDYAGELELDRRPIREQDFLRQLTASQKLRVVLKVSEARNIPFSRYVGQVRILEDPYVFNEFRRVILPEIVKGCGSSACHGGATTRSFRLVNDRLLPLQSLYTNFVVLDAATDRLGRPLIDRDRPEESLLLAYGLPPEEVKAPRPGEPRPVHPPTPTPLKPMFRSRQDRLYREIRDWMSMLRLPRPDYGIHVESLGLLGPANRLPADRAGEGP